jgi:hypothetical protein
MRPPITTNECLHKHMHLFSYFLVFSVLDLDSLEFLLVYILNRKFLKKKVKFVG